MLLCPLGIGVSEGMDHNGRRLCEGLCLLQSRQLEDSPQGGHPPQSRRPLEGKPVCNRYVLGAGFPSNDYRLNDVKMATAETSYYGTNFNAIFILFKPLLCVCKFFKTF